jgi:hypothetical protein
LFCSYVSQNNEGFLFIISDAEFPKDYEKCSKFHKYFTFHWINYLKFCLSDDSHKLQEATEHREFDVSNPQPSDGTENFGFERAYSSGPELTCLWMNGLFIIF